MRALAKKANKFEKVKNAKCGSRIWTEVQDLAALVREGKTTWEDLDLDDIDIRLKWAGLFHRRKRTPGKFMMRLKVSINTFNNLDTIFLNDRKYCTIHVYSLSLLHFPPSFRCPVVS